MDNPTVADILREHPFSARFWPEHVARLAAMASEARFAPGELIFQEGDHSSLIYLLISGNVALEVERARASAAGLHPVSWRSARLVFRHQRQRQAVPGARLGRRPRPGVRRRPPPARLRAGLCLRVRLHAGHSTVMSGPAACDSGAIAGGVHTGRCRMNIGVIRERGLYDRRVCLTPPVIRRLAGAGHTLWVESGAGEGAMYSAMTNISGPAPRSRIRRRKLSSARSLLAKIGRPTSEELGLLPPGHGPDGLLSHGGGGPRAAR